MVSLLRQLATKCLVFAGGYNRNVRKFSDVVDIYEVPSADPVAIGLQLQQQILQMQQQTQQQAQQTHQELRQQLQQIQQQTLNEYDSNLTQRK
jgi:hypothetical protein